MDPVLGRALEQVYSDLVAEDEAAPGSAPAGAPSGARTRTIWVTVVVAVVVVAAAALAIRAGHQTSRPAIAPTSSTTTESTALLEKLPKQPYGRTLHTWTDKDTTNTSGPFAMTGSTAVVAAVCDGGGAIMITDAHGSKHKEGCTRLDIQQPFSKFNLGGDGKSTKETKPVRVSVTVLSGSPRYIVRLWAVDPRILDADSWSVAATSATVPKALRTCTTQDIDPKATLDWHPNSHMGVITVSGRNTTDCAIRSWPSMRYRNGSGAQVGPAQGVDNNGRSIDPSEGAVDKYGEFPPARLSAGGKAYLILDLSTRAQLKQEDAEAQAEPRPTPTTGPSMPITFCEPEAVAAIQLKIGSATVTVPTPSNPIPAACRTTSRVFGIDPVVTKRPTVR